MLLTHILKCFIWQRVYLNHNNLNDHLPRSNLLLHVVFGLSLGFCQTGIWGDGELFHHVEPWKRTDNEAVNKSKCWSWIDYSVNIYLII